MGSTETSAGTRREGPHPSQHYTHEGQRGWESIRGEYGELMISGNAELLPRLGLRSEVENGSRGGQKLALGGLPKPG